MITDYFGPELEDIWFQQDGVTSHTAHNTIDLLKSKLHELLIQRNGPVVRTI